MTTTPMLDGPKLAPLSGKAPASIVVLLHGYGSNGADLISLAPMWQRALPDTLFIAPNAPERCPGAPGGYQWWGLTGMSRPLLAAGARRAAPALDGFLDRLLKAHGLAADRLLLVGFSQGTMMALHVGLARPQALAGIVGYSGMLADPAPAAADPASRPPVLLVHGDADPVVPVEGSREAERALRRAGVEVSLHVSPGVIHTIDPIGLGLGGRFAAKVLGA